MQKLVRSLFLLASIVLSHRIVAQVYGEPVVSWDFSNGIPQDWIVGINSTTDLAHWEYRGPNTEPNTTVGARGSCSAIAAPIASLTQSNGFVIFDGNHWDDAGTACGAGLGSGVDPAPHTAWLITSEIDFSTISSAVLTFQQQYRHFQTTTKVQISTNQGTTWTDILSNNSGSQSANVEWQSVNISNWAANQPSVQFKFIYSGVYYWWLLDDISVYVPNSNDLILTSAGYTNNPDINGLTSIANLEYDQYPAVFFPTLNFNGTALNVGSFNQTGVRLNSTVVKNETTEVYNQNSAAQTIIAGQSNEFNLAAGFEPDGIGDYTIQLEFRQDSIDEAPLNNSVSLDFSVTPYTYAKDEGPMEGKYIADSFYEQYLCAYGNFFNNPEMNRYCHSVQVGIAEGTELGKQIRAIVYNEAFDSLLATSNVYSVNYADLNELSEERMVYLDFEQPFQMVADSSYLVMVQEIDSVQPFFIARSGKSYGESSLVRYPNINASLISAKSFQVRLSLFAANAQPGCMDTQAMNFEASANIADGSCRYSGCTNEDADNYDSAANFDNGTCVVGGCMNAEAGNYNAFATYDNGTCRFPGCTSSNALNYDPFANDDDGSCRFLFTAIDAIDLTGCPPLTFQIANHNAIESNTICSYAINGTTIAQTCSPNFSYTLDQSGIYTLTYSISLGTATADTSITIEVLPTPSAPVLSYDAQTQYISCSNCANLSCQWFLNEIAINNATATSVAADLFGQTQNGTYTLEITNNQGCGGNSASLEILETSIATSVQSGCAPLSVEFFNTTDTVSSMICTLYSGVSIVEDFSGNSIVTYETPGTYSAELSCTGNSTTSSVALTIEVFDQFIPTLTIDQANGFVVCTNCQNAENLIWNVDGAEIVGGTQQPLGGDVYQIQASNAAGCGGSNLLIVNSATNIEHHGILVFPNPASEKFTVTSQGQATVDVLDITGTIVSSTNLNNSSQHINVTTWAAGMYVLEVTTSSGTTQKKIVIQH